MIRHRPYIGISGVMTQDEAATIVNVYENLCLMYFGETPPTHDLMLGVLASEKTLRGEPNKWPRRYPPTGEIGNIFKTAWLAVTIDWPIENGSRQRRKPLNLIHYASDNPPSIDVIRQLDAVGFIAFDGFQFNVSWPSPATLEAYAARLNEDARRGLRVVLQVGPAMIARMSIDEIVDRIDSYPTYVSVTDLLVDASGGRGYPVDVVKAASTIATFQARFGKTYRIGIAGGLSAESLSPEIGTLLRQGISIDAEGRLRDDADGGGNLNLEKVTAYLRRAIELSSSTSSTTKDQA